MQPSHYEDQYFLYIIKNDWIQVLNFFQIKLGMTAHACNFSTQEVETNPSKPSNQPPPNVTNTTKNLFQINRIKFTQGHRLQIVPFHVWNSLQPMNDPQTSEHHNPSPTLASKFQMEKGTVMKGTQSRNEVYTSEFHFNAQDFCYEH